MYETSRFSRYVMYESIEKWCNNNLLSGGIGKTVGGHSDIIKLYPTVKWEMTDIKTGVDAEKLPWENESVDILISDQMLEHVEHPWVVKDEMLRVLKPAGILIVTTCFLQKWHGGNLYFTFHMDGLKSLFGSSLKSYICEGWGNREANDLINCDDQIRYASVENDYKLYLLTRINDCTTPFSTWIAGRKA